MNPTLKLLVGALIAALIVAAVNVAVFGFPGTSSFEVRGAGRVLFLVDRRTGAVKACTPSGCWAVEDMPPSRTRRKEKSAKPVWKRLLEE